VNRRGLVVAVVVTAMAAPVGCSGASGDRPIADPLATTTAPSSSVDRCDVATPIDADNPRGPEVAGDATDATLYGLLFTEGPLPIHVGEEVKIVWRMTGQGDVSIRFVDPAGRDRPLVFGPEPHGGSNYDRPGDEWGSGFLFDRVGCWQIHLERQVGVGDVWIDVVA
jgi:hypothetical protein